MKKLYISFFTAVLLLSVSCTEDFFDRYPTDSMQKETYMTNDDEVENIMMDAYYYLRSISSNIITLNDLGTDVAYNRKKNNSTSHIELNECTWTDTFSISASVWSDCYAMINRCNLVLESIDKVMNVDKKTLLEGEAKFFRAYAYFNLVRLFGKVPYTVTVINDYKELYKYDRESVDKVYQLIKSDLTTAINNLPYEDEDGRATKIAAYTMLSEVYMTLKDFNSAKTNLKLIIDYANANPSKLNLEDDVLDIYDSQNPNGKEIIFAAQYNYGSTIIANNFMVAAIANIVTPANQPSYVYPDGTPSSILISQGNGTLLMTWCMYNKLKEDGGDRFTKLTYNGIFEGESTDLALDDEVELTDEGYAKVPTSLKYYDFNNVELGLTRCYSGCDNIIYRYADVLLMYAECLNETDTPANAATYLNIVRNRANVGDTDAVTKEEMASAIEEERVLELNFEGHRWFDLLRTDRLTPVMVDHFNHRTLGLSPTLQSCENGMAVEDASSTTGIPAVWKWENSSTEILFPIPYAQAQLNSNWEQNDAYK